MQDGRKNCVTFVHHMRFNNHFGIIPNSYALNGFGMLRFASCGQRGRGLIPFQELIVVFDRWIWLFIFITPFDHENFLDNPYRKQMECNACSKGIIGARQFVS